LEPALPAPEARAAAELAEVAVSRQVPERAWVQIAPEQVAVVPQDERLAEELVEAEPGERPAVGLVW
jgi:hypothetical protein